MEAASSWMAWQNILEGDAWHSPSSSHHRPAELLAQAGTSHASDPCRKLGGFSVHRRDDICTQPWTVAWRWKEEAHSSGQGQPRAESPRQSRWDGRASAVAQRCFRISGLSHQGHLHSRMLYSELPPRVHRVGTSQPSPSSQLHLDTSHPRCTWVGGEG